MVNGNWKLEIGPAVTLIFLSDPDTRLHEPTSRDSIPKCKRLIEQWRYMPLPFPNALTHHCL
eukprot:11480166-Karenia_brevis.AAC.1